VDLQADSCWQLHCQVGDPPCGCSQTAGSSDNTVSGQTEFLIYQTVRQKRFLSCDGDPSETSYNALPSCSLEQFSSLRIKVYKSPISRIMHLARPSFCPYVPDELLTQKQKSIDRRTIKSCLCRCLCVSLTLIEFWFSYVLLFSSYVLVCDRLAEGRTGETHNAAIAEPRY